MTPSLEGWPTKAKEAPSPHELRLALLDTNPVFQSLGEELSSVLSPLHKHFETDEKIYIRIDELITPFYNTIHKLV